MKVFQIKNKFIFLSSVITMYFNEDEKKISLILNKLTHTTFPIKINELQSLDSKDPKNYKIDSVLFSYDYTTIDLNEKYDSVTEEIKKFLVSNENLFSFDKFL
jgi:hypothetical protein